MKKNIKKLPDLELEVMQAVWDLEPPADRADVAARVRGGALAETTLLTILKRLQDKGFLRTEKLGRRSVYIPLVDRGDYRAVQSRRFVEQVCGGSIAACASALCDSGLSREEIDELRALLEKGEL